ncbi:MAG: HAD-IIIC family phosphatase [Alphaproteobacteria bacterium]
MNFLEANRTLKAFKGGPALSLALGMSGTSHQLDVYLRARGAEIGRSVDARYTEFGTLPQYLREKRDPSDSRIEVLLLTPWDFVPSLDWRLGVAKAANAPDMRHEAEQFAGLVKARSGAVLLYLPAPIPPVFHDAQQGTAFENWLTQLVASLGARCLPADYFAAGNYLATGCPIAGEKLSQAAEKIIDGAVAKPGHPLKLLITDLDNVLWSGIVAEDGFEGIAYGAEGKGYRHYIYQSFLRQLKSEGVILAAVSRNDVRDAGAPLQAGNMILTEGDFVSIVAGYGAKSAEIRAIVEQLNLGLESAVFVDDNPIELAEVRAALPQVTVIEFPNSDDLLPEFLLTLRQKFSRSVVTDEDRAKTEMYKRRAASALPRNVDGGDVKEFLRQLKMSLTINDRTFGPSTRAIQLINKTTQFNLNGVNIDGERLAAAIKSGSRIFTANLSDKAGDHGEILSLILSPEGVVESFVMSCRVFQRRVEHAFMSWLSEKVEIKFFRFRQTDRNEPMRKFLSDPSFREDGELLAFDPVNFRQQNSDALGLFAVSSFLDSK